MIVQHMIEEIEGILILLGKNIDNNLLSAFNSLPKEEIKAYRDSIAEEFSILNKGKQILLMD
jgi:hypothetical protein